MLHNTAQATPYSISAQGRACGSSNLALVSNFMVISEVVLRGNSCRESFWNNARLRRLSGIPGWADFGLACPTSMHHRASLAGRCWVASWDLLGSSSGACLSGRRSILHYRPICRSGPRRRPDPTSGVEARGTWARPADGQGVCCWKNTPENTSFCVVSEAHEDRHRGDD